jgi:hypothetical protein
MKRHFAVSPINMHSPDERSYLPGTTTGTLIALS